MATIQELWSGNGCKPGLKICRSQWASSTYLEVLDIRNKTVLGWLYKNGCEAKPCDIYSPFGSGDNSYAYDNWQVWVE